MHEFPGRHFLSQSTAPIDGKLLHVLAKLDELFSFPFFTGTFTVKTDNGTVLSAFLNKKVCVFFTNEQEFKEFYELSAGHLKDWQKDDSAGVFDPRIDPSCIFINEKVGISTTAQEVFLWATVAHEFNHFLHYHLNIPSPYHTAESGDACEAHVFGGVTWFGAADVTPTKPEMLYANVLSASEQEMEARYVTRRSLRGLKERMTNTFLWSTQAPDLKLDLLPADMFIDGIKKRSMTHKCCCLATDATSTTGAPSPVPKLVMQHRVPDRRPGRRG
ncbi:hypothetical protein HDU87_003380 [Geranomyces variabilis]|uniref:Uncharacterized protein n=1 Tax=Geranomyces variabilis TaxID=109894 RepID=A0AAD5TMH4_9FUNG|nr:hypothetical protein HDU87_003380 [Geranomyces variabilis]